MQACTCLILPSATLTPNGGLSYPGSSKIQGWKLIAHVMLVHYGLALVRY